MSPIDIDRAIRVAEKKSGTSRALKTGSAYLVVVCLCAFALFSVLHLKKASLSIPLNSTWDAYFYTAWVKNIVEGHYNVNPHLGAPEAQLMYDFPLPHTTHWLVLKFLSLFNRNFAVVLNVYFLLTFPMMGILSVITFRQFGTGYPAAILGGVLFAFLPYHLIRAESHLTYSSYYMVPLMVLVLLWLCSGVPLFRWDLPEQTRAGPWITKKGIASLVICALVACDTPYQAFFGAFFLIVAAAMAHFRYRQSRLRSAAILLCTLLVAFALDMLPSLLYQSRHGTNTEPVTRSTEEAEIYGLKMAQLLLPVSGHRNHRFQRLKNTYNQRSFPYWVNENDWASLGLLGTCGFLFLMTSLFLKSKKEVTFELLDALGLLNLSGFLLGTVGGIGALFAVLVSKNLRAYNRVSVFIAFFSLFAVVALLDRVLPRGTRLWFHSFIVYPAIAALLTFGVWDQTTRAQVPNYRELQKEYLSDDEFVKRIERTLPTNAMVFQLPYVAFPANPPVNRMYDYDHLRAYLHSGNLRWSYGAMRGRDVGNWQKRVSSLPVPQFVESLAFAGFQGIYLNREGYSDGGRTREGELSTAIGTQPWTSADQKLVFFDLTEFGKRLRETYSPSAWESKRQSALAPLWVAEK